MSRADRRRALGKVISVTADYFTVELNAGSDSFTLVGFDGQHYVARIGSFVLIPLQDEYIVAEITGLRDNDPASKVQGKPEIQDSQALLSIKYLDVVPVGNLPFRREDGFTFGVSVFPPLYSDVLYVQTSDLDRILDIVDEVPVPIDSPDQNPPTATTAFKIGTSVVFDDYSVKVKIDEFFGGHAAILGNTGSGKSCTVATIVQSVFEKSTEHPPRGASFLFFDTNGEYRQAFRQLPPTAKRRYWLVPELNSGSCPMPLDANETTFEFRLPHWFMSVEEWEMFLRASERTQQPILRTALGLTSMFARNDAALAELKNHILAASCLACLKYGDSVPAAVERIRSLLTIYPTDEINLTKMGHLLENKFGQFTTPGNLDGELLHGGLEGFLRSNVVIPDYQNVPFELDRLGDALDLALLYEESHGNRQIRDYCSSLITRFNSIRDRPEFSFMRPSPGSALPHEESPQAFVEKVLGTTLDKTDKHSQITILDMNEVEDEVVEVLSAVVTRLVFEQLRRLEPRNSVPVNLVLEEAHRYIPNRASEHAIDASRIFERVSKEGRKYGLFILLASQRPSELSRTVLSQCSNFIVHRIQNPEDLTHIKQMTPFISESILRRLPALPKQHALIFGNAVNVPTTFRVRDADPKPKSDDACISDLWFIPPFNVTVSNGQE